MYEDEEVAITKKMIGQLQPFYEIQSKDRGLQRSGYGYILLSSAAMNRLCTALQGKAW